MATHTLLVADDSQTVQRIVEMACAGQDVDVVTVADGDRAIARIEEHPPDIVLADIGMPGRNGYDVAAFIQGRPDLAHIPVVLMAGMFETADEARARSLGCAEVLVKPLKPQHVGERVRHWLEAPLSPAVEVVDAHPDQADAALQTGAPETSDPAEDYFGRLDAAFKSLGRPLGERLGAGSSRPASAEPAAGEGEHVPTLQELLDRLPRETRTRLVPSTADQKGEPPGDFAVLEAIATRLLDHLSRRDDLLDEIARRVALRQRSDDGR